MTRNIQKFCFAIFSLMLAFIISSCGKENVTPGSGSGTTGGNVDDPVGTVKLSMRNAANGDTQLDEIHIDKDDNFEGYRSWFASVGNVNGLGNVTGIPANGWAEKIAVVPGEGVVAYSDGKFYRIYVQDYVYSAGTNGVIGAEIRYQKPFGGADEAVKFDRKSITIDSKGGTEEVLCANATIIPFTVSSSEAWCRASTISTHEHSWLADGVYVECGENFSESSRTATITVTTQTKKQTTFTVTQAGGPIIKVTGQGKFEAFGGEQNLDIVTNQDFNSLQLNDVPSWLNAELIDNSAAESDASESSAKSYVLHLTAEGNPLTTDRSEEITIATKDGKLSEKILVTQSRGWFRDQQNNKSFDVNKDRGEFHAYFYSSVNPESLVLKISDSWVKTELIGVNFYSIDNQGYLGHMKITYETNPTLKDRSATINFYASDDKTLVYTYAVNQQAQTFDVKEKAYFDKKGGAQTVTISSGMTSWEASSSASWLTFSKNGNQITLRAEEYTGSSADRTATITFKDLDRKITVIQSKYAVGDAYQEGKITGTVIVMSDSVRLIRSKNLGKAAWSTENVKTGATSENDGLYNTNIIKAIPGYKTLYPAFALVEALNVDGATGWYLPALQEVYMLGVSEQVWSSSEGSDSGSAFSYYPALVYEYHGYRAKSELFTVYAVHRF